MIKSNYIKSTKITPRIKQSVVPGEHITIEGVTFEKLNKKPYGKTILRTLIKADKSEHITCYA
tara:strand:+ start:387 stop:575 length:189 start_codon:yes stop_codon:yes gene_type:complete